MCDNCSCSKELVLENQTHFTFIPNTPFTGYPTVKYFRIPGRPIVKQLFRANPTDAGLDIASAEDVTIKPRSYATVRTGIRLIIPVGWYGKIASRSGLAFRDNVFAFHGSLDASYRGEVAILMYNNSNIPKIISTGNRIAQIVFLPCWLGDVEETTSWEETERGENGFGSSGR